MTSAEFARYIEYFNNHGRLTPERMYDRCAALITWRIDRATGVESQLTDYFPFYKEPQVTASVDDVIKFFGIAGHGH